MVTLEGMIRGEWINGHMLKTPGPKFIGQLADLLVELHSLPHGPNFASYDNIPESNMSNEIASGGLTGEVLNLGLMARFGFGITILIVFINVIILLMIIKSKNYKLFFLLMVLGGSFGNLFDRLYYQAVPDFIDIHYGSFHWFVFNVADIFITIGIICLIVVEFILNNKKHK